MTENRRIFWNVIATYGRSLYGLVVGLLCGRWALLALGEVDYGLMGLVGGLIVFVSFFNNVLASANARFYAISIGAAKVAEDEESALQECRRWFNTALSVHSIVPFLLVLIGYPLGAYAIEHWLTIPTDRISACIWVFRFVCVSCFVNMVNVPFTAMYNAKQYIAELTIYSFVTSTLNVFMLGYMVSHPAVWLTRYAAWTCLLAVVPQGIICIRAMKIFPECRIIKDFLWDISRIKRLGWYSGWQLLGVFCTVLRTQGLSVIVNKFFGAAMNAAQTIGNTVQAQCNTLAGAMQGAFVPVITQACGAREFDKMNTFVIRTCKFNVILSIIFMLPLALELPEVMRLWLKTPPAYASGLCLCAMILYLVDASTTGHMVAVNAAGKIVGYHIVLSLMNVLLIPFCIVAGLCWRNVYVVMMVVIFFQILNSIGRLVFARIHAKTSLRAWMRYVAAPLVVSISVCALFGLIPRYVMKESLTRIGMTTIFCEAVLLPMLWLAILNADERDFVREKFLNKIVRKFRK